MADIFAILADFLMKVANKCARLADIPLRTILNFSIGGYVHIFDGYLAKIGGNPAQKKRAEGKHIAFFFRSV